jgi:HlyD family secretion protein
MGCDLSHLVSLHSGNALPVQASEPEIIQTEDFEIITREPKELLRAMPNLVPTSPLSNLSKSNLSKTNMIRRPCQRKIALILLPLALLLGSCSFGTPAPTPEPFTAPAYEPGDTPATSAAPTGEAAASAADTAVSSPAAQTESQAPADQSAAPASAGQWIYTGEIEPEDEVSIVSEVGGRVLEMNVKEGDRVSAGQLLLRVDSTTLEAQRAQALAGLQAAQAQVDLLHVQASDTDIEAARAGVAAAEAAYQRALDGPTAEDLTMAQSQLYQAQAATRRAQAAYDQVSWNPLIAALPESLQLQQATLAQEAAQAQYDKLVKGASEDVIAGAYAQLASARAQLQRLEDGPEDAQIQAAEAQVHQAETALYLAQVQLDKAAVRAPVDGIVSQVNLAVGAMALPGSPALRLLSPTVKIVIPVEENRMVQLKIGQPARIQVNAYPGQSFDGTLTGIAPQLDPATRTVRVTVQPTDPAAPLTPGMFATVELVQE